MDDLFGHEPESSRKRMARFRAKVEAPFIRNQFGLWCPQCGEQIADWEWVGDCDCCGYPSEVGDDSDDDEERR
jgi:methionyl-tRNA synthetase